MIAAPRLALLLAGSAALSSVLPGDAHAQRGIRTGDTAAAALAMRVDLNGEVFASGVALREGDRPPRLLLDLADLRAAVDGADPRPRLRVHGGVLYATAGGGCAGCLLRVQRPVLISARVERVADRLYLPLDDFVRAVEGRLVEMQSGGVYAVHVGVCTWCILEPAERPRP